jgi:hypothetical protein
LQFSQPTRIDVKIGDTAGMEKPALAVLVSAGAVEMSGGAM